MASTVGMALFLVRELYKAKQIREEHYTKVIFNIPSVAREILDGTSVEHKPETLKFLAEGAILARNRTMGEVRDKMPAIAKQLSFFMKENGLTYEQLKKKIQEKNPGANEDKINEEIIKSAGRANQDLLDKFYNTIREKLPSLVPLPKL